jgi:hypothetical protein
MPASTRLNDSSTREEHLAVVPCPLVCGYIAVRQSPDRDVAREQAQRAEKQHWERMHSR